MKCPTCGMNMSEESNYCDNCGTSLGGWFKSATLKCSNCGTDNVDSNRYCLLCGQLLHKYAEVEPRLMAR